jgi:hypothetical protein
MKIKINDPDPELFLQLYTSVGWDPPCREQVETALKYTYATFAAMDGDIPVRTVRFLGDGGMSFYLNDFAVVPEYHH